MSRSEMRKEKMQKDQEILATLKENQRRLMEEKMTELKERVEQGEFVQASDDLEKIELIKLEPYDTERLRSFSPKDISVDHETFTVLFPVGAELVPIHVACIRNLTKTTDKSQIVLRVNLHTPLAVTQSIVFPQHDPAGSHIYIKELSFRSSNYDLTVKTIKDVKELLKSYKLKLTMKAKEISSRSEEVLEGKIRELNHVKLRPTLEGRKSEGQLIAYHNGFKFVTKNQKSLTIFNSNIRHVIYQPCEENMFVLVHFLLKKPIVIQKQLTEHVQVFTEIGSSNQDLVDPRQRNRQAMDEYEEEEREEEQRLALNQAYFKFVKEVESKWNLPLKFDVPF